MIILGVISLAGDVSRWCRSPQKRRLGELELDVVKVVGSGGVAVLRAAAALAAAAAAASINSNDERQRLIFFLD